MKHIKVGDKVRHTFSREYIGTVMAIRDDPSGYDIEVAFYSEFAKKITTDWYKTNVLLLDITNLITRINK